MNVPRVSIVGSINMDLVTKTKKIPNIGETVLGEEFFTSFGGKGANQAIASARLGAEVKMFGCVGEDENGSRLIHNLQQNGVNTDNISIIPDVSSGVATITISENDNSIIVVPGANKEMTPDLLNENRKSLIESDVILASLEIPLETIVLASEIAKEHDIPFVLNPAPAMRLPDSLFKNCTLLTPNEHELAVSLGHEKTDIQIDSILEKYKGQIVVTRGGSEAILKDANGRLRTIPSFQVETVDTTGAGDAFNGAVAYMLAKGEEMIEAVSFAMVVGALSVTKEGAQNGLPCLEECIEFLRKYEENPHVNK